MGKSLGIRFGETEPELRPGRPEVLFEGDFLMDPFAQDARNYDVAPDGSGFVMVLAEEDERETSPKLHVVLNWFEELKRLAPVDK